MNISILNHLFLPISLPSSSEDDFCIQFNHRNEHILLECINEFFSSCESIDSNIQLLIDCTQRWSMWQRNHNLSVSHLKSLIEQLPSGSFLPMYFHAQNAAILIEIDSNQPLISSWQVLLPTDTVTSSTQPHLSNFPVTTYRLPDRSSLCSTIHCELLLDFVKNTVEYSKSYKGSREVMETREVPVSHYVCHWWIQRFPGIIVEKNLQFQFSKKHRDQVRWSKGHAPFRRSGLWMTIKVVFQTILTKRLGNLGTVVYKLLITHFLTYIIHSRHTSMNSVDFLVHGIRKILRRLNKIESSLPLVESKDLSQWIQLTKQDIQKKIDDIFPSMDWQQAIRMNDEQDHRDLPMNDTELYRHPLEILKKYLSNDPLKVSNTISSNGEDEPTYSIPSFSVLTNQRKYPSGIALTHMELWVTSWTDQWLKQPSSSRRETENFQMIAQFFEDYQHAALVHYLTDPMGYTRFLLTSLTILRAMHYRLCQDKRFERLQFHCIDIPNLTNLFEYFILPTRADMIRARDLADYFQKFARQLHPDLLTKIDAENSFGVHFARDSTKMNSCLRKLQAQVEQDKAAKIEEVRKAKDKYNRLMNSISGFPCTCCAGFYDRQCRRCRIEDQANNIEVSIYECPIPIDEAGALAVMFELRMPIELRCYRDVLWQFVNRCHSQSYDRMYEWLRVLPHSRKLEPLFTGPKNYKVKLVSFTNSITQTHNSNEPIAMTSIEDFLYENSLQLELSPVQVMAFSDECQMLTPQLNHPDYTRLQFSLQSTQFVQNRVIADLSHGQQQFEPKQMIEFGSFRSGHRLQWWNLLSILEMDALSFNKESVAVLITHALLQYGPIIENSSSSWCSEAHEQLLDDHFVDELIGRLNGYLDECSSNWKNELTLVVVTMMTMRILTICNTTREDSATDLALKCRSIGEKWIDQISSAIQLITPSDSDKIENLRRSVVLIGVACLLTFATHPDRIHCVLSSNPHMISLLKAATNVHDNSIVNNKRTLKSTFVRNIIRYSERVLVQTQPVIGDFLQRSSNRCLDDFSGIYWAVIGNDKTLFGKWKKRTKDTYDGWYDGQYGSTPLSIDCSQGIFLVNGMSVGYLPEKIISDELYGRVFGHYIFQVQMSDSPNTYITKYSYHDDEQVRYEFHYHDPLHRLIIRERHIETNEIFELIPSKCFDGELPSIFVSEYSHWKSLKDQIIEFRPISFKDPNFLTSKPYILNIDTGYVITTDPIKSQILVNQSSVLFQHLFTKYFNRLDDKPYVYMLREDASNFITYETPEMNTTLHIHLSRLAMAFKYNTSDHCCTSREYPDMCIDDDQWLGTLTGFKCGLLLSPIRIINLNEERYAFRKLIVPFGQVSAKRRSSVDHQIVILQRKPSMSDAHQYFVFVLNDRLGIIQSTDSPTGWLYLALLHAMTSHPLPDQYTGMTGMERAFQLLNSAGCWTDQPFNSLSLSILHQIAALSPKASYYRQGHTCMQNIVWNSHIIPYSLQHCGYYLLVKKLINTSEKFSFMHSSSPTDRVWNITDENEYDEKLLSKLYWDYRPSYNPTARLSAEIETEMLDTRSERPYQPSVSSDREEIPLVNDMYRSGDVHLKDISELHCFPLNRWLTDEYALNTVWIGLLKLVDSIQTNSADEIERFALLLDFLHYISSKRVVRSVYLQMLNTVLQSSEITLNSIVFPSFTQYNKIQHISVTPSAIDFNSSHSANERRVIVEEVKDCFDMHYTYKDHCRLATTEEKHQIKFLLKSWQLNRKLHTFLTNVQTLICSYNLIPLNSIERIPIASQEFILKSLAEDCFIDILSTEKQIDRELLVDARRKYRERNSDSLIKSTVEIETVNVCKEFPEEIFSAIDNPDNHLRDLGNYFKNQLANSWKQLQSTKTHRVEFPSKEELSQRLESSYQESTHLWNALIESLTASNRQLFQIGLFPRAIPTILVSILQQIWLNEEYGSVSRRKAFLSDDQCTLLGGILVHWIVEQQIERALNSDNHEEFEKELSNTPHTNWIPSKHLPWLIFELEMNLTIRAIQVDVARHMIQPTLSTDDPSLQNIVMQMNMGEGKTSVIIPMLALSLCSPSSSLVRVVVLKSLYHMNYQSLRSKLGGLVNRRLFPFACRRDMNFNNLQVTQIFERLQQGLRNRDIVLVSPEDILSFDLLTIDKCRRQDFDAARSMLNVQRWLKHFARDVLDESDEVLHCKYQLIYTVGAQQQVDGGVERWKLVQLILHSVKTFAADIVHDDQTNVFYRIPARKSAFPEFRLLSHQPFTKLCVKLVHHWLNQKCYRKMDKQSILSFVLDIHTSVDALDGRFSAEDIQLFLILRGLLSAEVLLVALKKRYRVNYGVNLTYRSMAVPFRAKDVPADRTEFGHPDTALILTQLSYYYSGLSDSQLLQCIDRLQHEERDPELIYAEWISQEDENDVPQNLKQWKGVNLKDCQQESQHIFHILRYNMFVIDYFLNCFVFPREAKQFPQKLISSAWDLSSTRRTQMITGFSGTNDTQLLLPVRTRQCDLSQLQSTDAIVINNLLQPENENYRYLPLNATSETILRQMASSQPTVNVILDVGALFIDSTDREIAVNWLKLSDKAKIDYAIYFDCDCLVVCDRHDRHYPFLTSPASERLDRCVIYLDELHTRGTDFKFPSGFTAAVTLGNDLTKDRFVQACMRMRKLGHGHSLIFWSSQEVHRQIGMLKMQDNQNDSFQLRDILRWVYENTQQATWDGLHHWAVQSLSFQRKLSAFHDIQWTNDQQIYTDQMMEELAEKCLEPEILELKRMYGVPKVQQTISEIYANRYENSDTFIAEELHTAVLKRMYAYGGSKQRLSQFLDEEQQRELEQELEQEQEQEPEHEQKLPRLVRPCEPILHDEIKRLCDIEEPPLNLAELPLVFRPLPYAFADSTFSEICEPNSWQGNLWISTEFQRVIETKDESLDAFLRPPRWMVVYRNEHIIFVNAFEANWLMGQLRYLDHTKHFSGPSITTLRLLLPRLKRNQSIFVNTPALTIPPFIPTTHDAVVFVLPVDWLVELFLFNGTIYFATAEEQTSYCQRLALCPKPRTTTEEDAFENGWIAVDGFVQESEHRSDLFLDRARVTFDPLPFVKQLLKIRNNAYASSTSHVGSVIYHCLKLLSSDDFES